MIGMKGLGQAMLKTIAEGRVPKPEEADGVAEPAPESSPISFSMIYGVRDAIMQAGYKPEDFSIVIPARDFCHLLDDSRMISFKIGGSSTDTSTMRVYDIEILRGASAPDAGIGIFGPKMVESNRKALDAEILRCLGRDAVGKLPKSPSSDRVSPRAEPIGKIPVTPSPASGDDRNPNSLAHLSDEAKVIAAKEAVAAYGRNKQLPSASVSALFRELDGKAAGNKGAAPKHAWQGVKWVVVDDINRNDHSLSTEPLSRAIDQIWVRENSGSYADLVSSRAERLAEMVCRGDSAADGERG